MAVSDALTVAQFDALVAHPLAVAHFWASWCQPCAAMDAALAQLASTTPAVTFVRVEAEEVDDLAMRYNVPSVPYFLLFKGGQVVDRLEGANAPALTAKVQSLTAGAPVRPPPAAPPGGDIVQRVSVLVHSAPVMLFMKGSPDAPKCGFSRRTVEALVGPGACPSFGHFDILTDQDVRDCLKKFSDWPTYPQLYIRGELIGGCDIVEALAKSGELATQIAAATAAAPALAPAATAAPQPEAKVTTASGQDVAERIKALLASHRIMLFMKGTPEQPQCGFSRRVVEALRRQGVDSFGSFNILTDEAVRAGVKTFSDWPTFPQLFKSGELLGGCDIVEAMEKSGELKAALGAE